MSVVLDFLINHWEAISSLLLSLVAIGIAIYSSYKTSKDATRQIESIKELARLQIEATISEIEMEVSRQTILMQRAYEESRDYSSIMNNHNLEFRKLELMDYESKKPSRDMDYSKKYLVELKKINTKLNEVKSKLK